MIYVVTKHIQSKSKLFYSGIFNVCLESANFYFLIIKLR